MQLDETFKTRIRQKGQITVPAAVRSILDADEGDDLVFFLDHKGRVIVERARTIPPEQAWFWSERWQALEKEAQEDVEAGRLMEYDSVESLIEDLDSAGHAED